MGIESVEGGAVVVVIVGNLKSTVRPLMVGYMTVGAWQRGNVTYSRL